MVGPHSPTNETNCRTREHHEWITKQRLTREHRENFGDDSEARKNEDVYLGMTEDPEQVLPQERVGAGSNVEERCAKVALERK